MAKYSILSCIFGGYEMIREVENPDPDIEYIMVTDDENLTSDTWTILFYPNILDFPEGPDRWAYVRYHPFEFVNTDICLYIDGSVQIKDNPISILEEFEASDWEYGTLMNTLAESGTNSIEVEVERWAHYGFYGYCHQDAGRVLDFLKKQGWEDKFGLVQSTMIIYKNTKFTNMINNHTWTIMWLWGKDYTVDRINQTALTYAIHKLAWHDSRFIILHPRNLWCKYFEYCYHHSYISQKKAFEPFVNMTESEDVSRLWNFYFQNRHTPSWVWHQN